MIKSKQDVWQLLRRKNPALDGERVSMTSLQVERLVYLVWELAETNEKRKRSDDMFNTLFRGITR